MKSPKKALSSPKKKLKDLLVLPQPYNDMTSDEIKRWEKSVSAGEEIDEEVYPEYPELRQEFHCLPTIHKLQSLAFTVCS